MAVKQKEKFDHSLSFKEQYNCSDCFHKTVCEKDYGLEREDGDDYRAVIGTHLCRRSWDLFYR
jgi:hypothetical protein